MAWRSGRLRRSWLTTIGLGLLCLALGVVCLALPVWVLASGDLNGVAGWANVLAFPATVLGLVLVVVDRRRTRRAEPAQARRPIWMAPPLDRMIDRPDLGDGLLATLTAPGGADVALTTALHGAGGFGKTRLATWVVHRPEVRQRFPGGLLWVAIGQELRGADLAVRINDLIFALTGQRSAFSEPDAAGAELGRLLDERKPILLVVDDVWEEGQLRPFRFGGRHCTRLVTSRIPDLFPPGGVVRIAVDAMSSEQACALVADGVDELPSELVGELARLAGRWPVLLNLVNGVLRRRVARGQRPADAARVMVDQLVAEGPAVFDPNRPADRTHAVVATVGASLRLLGATDRERYLDLGVFPEDVEIPQPVLELLWPDTRPHEVCEELVGLGLVADYRLDPPGPRLLLHDVIRAFLLTLRSPTEWAEVHRRLVDAAAERISPADGTTPWWSLPVEAGYLWRYLPYHLSQAGRADELARLVGDLRWIEAKTSRTGSVVAVAADLDLARTPTTDLLRRQLAQAAPLLGPIDPSAALGHTLASRLRDVPGLADVVDRYRAGLGRPRLEPGWPLPDHPDGVDGSRPGHTGGVTNCCFSPDGRYLATVSDDGTARIWAVSDGSQRLVLPGHTGGIWDCAYSPDGRLLATASTDRTVRLWDTGTGEPVAVLHGHTDWVLSCAFSPDGTLLASTGADRTVRLWRVAEGVAAAVLTGHVASVRTCAFTPDGKLLASAGDDGTARLWRVGTTTGAVVLSIPGGTVWDCAFAPDGAVLATATSGAVRLWRVANRRSVGVLTGPGDEIDSCAFSPDGKYVAGTSYGMVHLWRLADSGKPTRLVGHTGAVWGCAFSPDGTLLATVSNDQTARLWRVDDGSRVRVIAGGASKVNSCAYAPDGGTIAISTYAGQVALLHADTGAVRRVLTGFDSRVISCAFSPDGRLLSATGKDTVRIWSVADGSEYAVLTGHSDWVRSCAFSPDGALLATASADRTVRLWDVGTGTETLVLRDPGSGFRSCAFSPDGAILAAGTASGLVRMWRMGADPGWEALTGHTGGVHGCAFSPDGSLLATVSGDRTVRLWRVADRNEYARLTGHTSWADRCAFSPDGSLLATVSNDQTVRIWRVADAECQCALRVAGPLSWIAWQPDGRRLCAVGGAGVYLFDHLA